MKVGKEKMNGCMQDMKGCEEQMKVYEGEMMRGGE
jgi:hypothetical protein